MAIMVDESKRSLRDATLKGEEGVTEIYLGRSVGSLLGR